MKEIRIWLRSLAKNKISMGFALAFIGGGMLTVVSPAFGWASEAMDGGGTFSKGYLLTAVIDGCLTLVSLVYFAFVGCTVRWQGTLLPRVGLRYPKAAYRMTGGGQGRHYLLRVAVTVLTAMAFQFPTEALRKQGLPTGISTFLAWSPGFWLALAGVWSVMCAWRLLRRRDTPPPRALWWRFSRRRVLRALIAAGQLGGIGLAIGFSWRVMGNPLVWIMVLAAWTIAWQTRFLEVLQHREERAFRRATDRRMTAEAEHFLAGKVLFYTVALPFVANALAALIAGVLQGFPDLAMDGAQIIPMSIAVIGALGNRVCMLANLYGDIRYNWLAVKATLFLVPVWGLVLEGLRPTVGQIAGSAIALGGGILTMVLLRDKKVREELPEQI